MENFETLFEQSAGSFSVKVGSIVNATVIAVDSKHVTVNANLKSDSLIPLQEFRDDRGTLEVEVGDNVQVVIDNLEDGYGETKLSREKAKRFEVWAELEQALETQETLSGLIFGRTKGGLGVLYKNIKLFLPGSLLDIRPVRDFAPFDGKTIEFKVIKIDRKRNNIVVSRKEVLLDTYGEDNQELINRVQEGNVVKGIVKNITDYGAFVDLDGIDGLLYITDLSWKRVRHPSELLHVGQEVEAKVLRFDQEKHRVSLGLKQLALDPWSSLDNKYNVGDRVIGRISNITDYGAFVELDAGVEGLVHVSEMDWANKNAIPSKLVKLGDEVEVQILDLDPSKRRISLGIKQCHPNPWLAFSEQHKKGDVIKGLIRSITDFGLFVGLDNNIDGLVHVSDISWSQPQDVAIRAYKKGQEVEAIVLSIDLDKERVALGIKQLENDNFGAFILNNDKGSKVLATVKIIEADRAIVELATDVEATLMVKELASGSSLSDLQLEEEIEALITSVDRKNRTISISVRALANKEDAIELKKINNKEGSSGTTNLGALLQDKLSEE